MKTIQACLFTLSLPWIVAGCTVGEATPGAAREAVVMPGALAFEPTPTKDIRLLHLRQLAIEAPVEDLVEQWNPWFAWFHTDYLQDLALWHGVDRLAQWALAHEPQVSEQLAMSLVSVSVGDPRGATSYLGQQRDALKQLRQRKRSVQVAAGSRTG